MPARTRGSVGFGTRNLHDYLTVFGELERVTEKIAQNLAKSVAVDQNRVGDFGPHVTAESQLTFASLGVEQLNRLLDDGTHLTGFGCELVALSLELRKVQDVVHDLEQRLGRPCNHVHIVPLTAVHLGALQ